LTALLARLLSSWRAGGDNLFFIRQVALLGRAKTALGQFIGCKLAHTVIRANLVEKAIIG